MQSLNLDSVWLKHMPELKKNLIQYNLIIHYFANLLYASRGVKPGRPLKSIT